MAKLTIKQTLTKGTIMLKNSNIESPKLKARLLLQYILKKSRQYLIVYDNQEVDKKAQWEYRKANKRNAITAYNSYARIYENGFLC